MENSQRIIPCICSSALLSGEFQLIVTHWTGSLSLLSVAVFRQVEALSDWLVEHFLARKAQYFPERPKTELKLELKLQLRLPARQKHKYKYILVLLHNCWLSKKRKRFLTDSAYQSLKRWWGIATSSCLVLPSGRRIYYVFIGVCLTPFSFSTLVYVHGPIQQIAVFT